MASFTVLREPSARYWYTWTPTLIRAAEIAANSGNLRLAADLCEWMLGDDRVQAVMDTRCDALLGLPFELKPQGDGRRSGQVAATLGEDWEQAFPDAELKKLLGWGVLLGIGLAQIIYEEGDGGRLVPRLEVWSPRWLSWDWDSRQWMIEAADSGGMVTSKQPITPGDGQWIIYTPSGVTRPWVHGAYRALARWTLLKQYALTDWGYYSERLGQGVWSVETAAAPGVGSGTSEQRKELAADLQNLGRNAAVALNPGQSLKLIESVARSQENFKSQIELADNGTAVSILGQNLSTQAGSGGSIGSASLHGKVAHSRTRMDGKTLPVCLREQAIKPLVEFNHGDRSLAPRPWWNTDPVDDEAAKATLDGSLVVNGILTPNEARAKRGLRPLAGGDVLRGNAPAPAPEATKADDQAEAASPASVEQPTRPSADDDTEE